MKIVGYSNCYQKGVICCLKRNYAWMEEKTDDELLNWMEPIIHYKWESEFPIEQFPYKFGMVLLDDEEAVVGYLGLIYSRQLINGSNKTVVNPTTWAIDEGYRSETFKCIYYVQQTTDIVADYTARESLVEIFTKMFHYKNVDKTGCLFLPIPYFGKRNVRVKRIESATQIARDEIRKIFKDHVTYGIKCFEISNRSKKEYLFYKIIKKVTVLKRLVPLDGICVLFTSDSNFFGLYAREIIWKMQRIEHAALRTDSRYFNINADKWKKLRTYPINRLVYGADDTAESLGAVYTELSILLNE